MPTGFSSRPDPASRRSTRPEARAGPPVGAYGGRRDLMERMAPSGPVYQAGTLSGNPLAMAAGIAMLRQIAREPPYAELERKGALLEEEIRRAIGEAGAEGRVEYE